MNTRRLVTANLLRTYRPVALWFWATMIVCVDPNRWIRQQ